MGVDVVLYAMGEATDGELAAAEEFMKYRMPQSLGWRTPEPGEGWLYRGEDEDGTAVVALNTPSRYYGVGYERGCWPSIYGAIRLMGAAFPGRAIRYGGDTSFSGDLVTPAMLEAMWERFLGPDGDLYHRSMVAFSAKLASRWGSRPAPLHPGSSGPGWGGPPTCSLS